MPFDACNTVQNVHCEIGLWVPLYTSGLGRSLNGKKFTDKIFVKFEVKIVQKINFKTQNIVKVEVKFVQEKIFL